MRLIIKNWLFGSVKSNSALGDLGLLLLRGFSGVSLALAHGLGKLPPSPQFMAGIERLGLPGEAAYLSGLAETVGGLALAGGLATRPAALIVAGNMSVAAFLQHANDPFQRAELAYLYLAVAVMFLLMGAGRFGLDRLITR
jgi:putative oxidoreductase